MSVPPFSEPDSYGRQFLQERAADGSFIGVAPVNDERTVWRVVDKQQPDEEPMLASGVVDDLESAKARAVERYEHEQEVLHLDRARVNEPKTSVWGPVQTATRFGPGIVFVETAGHGGFVLDRQTNAQMPPELRADDGIYEEDAEWALVALGFPSYFTSKEYNEARRAAANWYPDAYERHFGVELGESESFKKAQRAFNARHTNDLVVVSAIKDDDNPGWVWATAVPGGERSYLRTDEERTFLVEEGEYKARSRFGFVIDLERHQEVTETPSMTP